MGSSKSKPSYNPIEIVSWLCSCKAYNRCHAGTATRKCKDEKCGKYWVYDDKKGEWKDDYYGGKSSYYEPWQNDPDMD
ncbi:hypothetical protein MFRU_044g00480 [Monilinia fructicola]|nr:hypothetical protein MFRU_044g00480 [Monilinia fructicola]